MHYSYQRLTTDEYKCKANAYLSVIYEVMDPEDNMLVVVHKDVLNLFTELNQHKKITFINWGNHAGSNAWSHYNKATIIGWFRTPQHTQASKLFAGADGYHNYEPTISYDIDVKNLENSSIVEDMVQFYNRIRCRIPIDVDGSHEPVGLYLFRDNTENDKKIVNSMIEEFPDAIVKQWEVKAGSLTDTKIKKKTKVTERSDLIISELKMMREKLEDVMAETIRSKLAITKSAFSRSVGSDYFKELLETNHIAYEIAKGSIGNQMKFTFK